MTDIPPLAPRLPQATDSFNRKWGPVIPLLPRLRPDVVYPILELDLDRVRRGQYPISAEDTIYALQAAQSKEAITQPPRRNFLERVFQDVKLIGTSIPKLPGMVLNEARQLPNIASDINQGRAQGENLVESIATAPGIRLIPGAFTVESIASGQPSRLSEHPLMAALDLLPYANKAAVLAKGKGIGQLLTEQAKTLAPRLPGVGHTLEQTMAEHALRRGVARITAQGNREVARTVLPTFEDISRLSPGKSPEDVVRMSGVIERGDPAEIASLPADERSIITRIRDMKTQFQRERVSRGLTGIFDNEEFPIRVAERLNSTTDAMSLLKTLGKNPPARFMPLVRERVAEALRTADPELHPTAVMRETSGVWLDLKAAGHDPIYLHPTEPAQVAQLERPSIFPEHLITPTSVRSHTFDAKPYIPNFQIGLAHEALEIAQHDVTSKAISIIKSQYGRPLEELVSKYEPIAARLPQPYGLSDTLRTQTALQRDWIGWDPESAMPWTNAVLPNGNPNLVYVPRTLHEMLSKMYTPRSRLNATFDKAMGAFRISILPLSPRWHLYNVIGGGILLAARTDPRIIPMLRDAYRMARSDSLPLEVSTGMGSVPRELAYWHYAAGRTAGRLFGEAPTGFFSRARQAATSGIDRLYAANEFVDKMYRSAAYLHGKKYGYRGLAGEEAGLDLANRILQDWDSMTPFERQTMRTVFPFYGWMRHILTYAMTYPFDHPLRASIVAKFARNEFADWQSGIPEQFWSMFVLGKPDIYGNVRTVNLAGSNPFSDVSNYMTIAGFMSQLNPLIQGFAESRGIDSRTASAELYPESRFDHNTGRLVARTQNPLLSIISNFIPQGKALATLFGHPPDDLRALMESNPEAFRQAILSSTGWPAAATVPRTVNFGKEAARSELARRQGEKEALSRALSSGRFSEASEWPNLGPILSQVRDAYSQGQLAPFLRQPPVQFRGNP